MLLMIVAAAAALQAVTDVPARGAPSEAQFAHARQALEERLLDYPSARFRGVRADDTRVCGYVNAKNAMGAYSGWKLFGVLDTPGTPIIVIDDAYMSDPICTPSLMRTRRDYSASVRHR